MKKLGELVRLGAHIILGKFTNEISKTVLAKTRVAIFHLFFTQDLYY